MRLDLLLLREPFEDNFKRTLSRFLSSKFGWQGDIIWKKSGAKFSARKHLRVNHKLNVIYPVSINRDVIHSFTAEYAFHPNPLRRLAQTLYAQWAIRFPLDRFLSIASVEIHPWPDCVDSWCIIPGNHSLRIVDFSNDQCFVILKQGFNNAFIEQEINIRKMYPELPIPQLKQVGDDGLWYSEELISALPLNRIPEINRQYEALTEAKSVMRGLYEKTSDKVSSIFWAEQLQQKIIEALACLPVIYIKETKQRIEAVSKRMLSFVCAESDRVVKAVVSHGDFQPANILVSKLKTDKSIYLIDWEYSANRVSNYDEFVFELKSRFPAGLASRIESLLLNNNAHQKVSSTIVWESWEVALCLLEELLVRVQENQIPGMKKESKGLHEFLHEVEIMSWLAD